MSNTRLRTLSSESKGELTPLSDSSSNSEGIYYLSKPTNKLKTHLLPSQLSLSANLFEEGFSWKRFWAFCGPGWLMSIAYLDPGNLESDLQAAALCGNSLLWILLWAHILGLLIQNLASQLGVTTGKHLAYHIKRRYPSWIATVLWLMCELAIIGSDIQEVVGTAIALQILFKFPLWLGVIITAFDTFTFLLLHRFGMKKLESFFMALIATMAFCFVASMVLAKPHVYSIVEGLVIPTVPKYAAVQAVAMVGAIIMPHNIFLHSALVAERKDIDRVNPSKRDVKLANWYFFIESALALSVSFFINLAIMVVFAQVFYYSNDSTPQFNVGLADAADALSSVLGENAKYLWAVGLLAAGQSSTMTGTLAGQYVMEGFWKFDVQPWQRVTFTRSVALVPSMLVAVLANNHLDTLGEYLNALQSLQLPFALIPLLTLVADERVMGRMFALSNFSQKAYTFVTAVLLAFNGFLVGHLVIQQIEMFKSSWVLTMMGTTTAIAYIWFIFKLIKHK